jgi:parallel beta-helix repeat protein
MEKPAILAFASIILLACIFQVEPNLFKAEASGILGVHNVNTGFNYTSIQNAVDAAETLNGHTILVDAGTYLEHVVVSKSLEIVGAGRNTTTIDGGGGGTIVYVAANNVGIEGIAVRHGLGGIYLDHSNNSVLVENSVSDVKDTYAIYASYSDNCTIEENIVGPNLTPGILVTNSLDFRVSNNYAHDNAGYGLNANASMNGLIRQNFAFNNSYDGIGLGKGCRNCTVTQNNVSGNMLYGIWLDSDSVDNLIYDNNIIDNGKQASVYLANRWDNGVEGNYWSDYGGADQDHDGIADIPLVISENNTDNYPLLGDISIFSTSPGFDVNVISNSSITDFAYFDSNGTIRMQVLGRTNVQDYGFCRVRIPHALMTEPYNVTVDGANPLYSNYTLHDDGDNRWIYFAYQHSTHDILIEGNPPGGQGTLWYSVAAGIVVIAVIASIILVYFRKLRKKSR